MCSIYMTHGPDMQMYACTFSKSFGLVPGLNRFSDFSSLRISAFRAVGKLNRVVSEELNTDRVF